MERLEEAADFFEQSVKQKPGYMQARLNLAATYFYLQKYNQAAGVVEEALKIAPDDPEVRNMLLLAKLADHEGEEIDYLSYTVDKLLQLIKEEDAPLSVYFNLAQLLDRQQGEQSSAPYWNFLHERISLVPRELRTIVSQKILMGKQAQAHSSGEGSEKSDTLADQGRVSVWDKIRKVVFRDLDRESTSATSDDTVVHNGSPPGLGEERYLKDLVEERVASKAMRGEDFRIGNILKTVVDRESLSAYAKSENETIYYYGSEPLLSIWNFENVADEEKITVAEVQACCDIPANKHATNNGDVWVYETGMGIRIKSQKIVEFWNLAP